MNFPGTLDIILNTFSHQQLKTIEAALSSTFATTTTTTSNNGSTCGNSAAPFNFLHGDHLNQANCHNTTPPTWAEHDLTKFDDDDIEPAMNNLPKVQQNPAGGPPPAGAGPPQPAPAGGVPAATLPNQQLAEYLAMQQQAQQLHQQQTQQQNNQALLGQPAAQVAGHFLNNRAFNAIESQHSLAAIAAGGGGMKQNAAAPPPPPMAIPQLTGPASMTISQVAVLPVQLTHSAGGPPPLAQQQPHHHHPPPPPNLTQPAKQQQPLALTRSPPPLLIKTPATATLIQAAGDHSTGASLGPNNPLSGQPLLLGHNSNNAAAQAVVAATGPLPQLHTTTVKLSYQQKDATVNAPPTAAPPPLQQIKPNLGAPNSNNNNSPVLPVPASVAPPPIVPIERPAGGMHPTVPQQPATNPNLKATGDGSTTTADKVKPAAGQIPLTPPPNNNNNNNNNTTSKASSAAPKAAVPATVTTPSKTSMKLATVTTPRIKQTARKNQSALQQQRSPTNLASISPVKTSASPVAAKSSSSAAAAAPSTNDATPQKAGPAKAAGGGAAPVVEKSVPLALEKAVTVAALVAPTAAVVSSPPPLVVPVEKKPPKKARETKAKGIVAAAVAGEGRSAGSPAAGASGSSSGGKAKRNRIKTVPYQIPTPEMTLAQKLSIAASEPPAASKRVTNGGERAGGSRARASVDSGGEDKLTLFYKNEFVAVRNAEDGFFLCQVLQNVFKSSPKIRIRWLSETGRAGVYSPDFYDVTDLECILTNVELEKDKGEYALPKEEQTRIENILKKAMGLLAVSEITEDNPDGLDLSIYKDEAQLERKESHPSGATKKRSAKRERKQEEEEGSSSSSSSEGAPLRSAKKPVAATKRASNGVPKGRAPSSPVPSSSKETPTRVSKRARAIQSPNYREDDDDDLPLAARTVAPITPKVAKVVEKAAAAAAPKPVTPTASPVAKKKPAAIPEAKKEAPIAVIPSPPVAAPTPSVAVKKPAVKAAATGGGAAAVAKPGPKPKGKEMKVETPKVVPVAAKEKKTPGKRKAEPEVKVARPPQPEEVAAEVVSPVAVAAPPPAKKAKASPAAAKKVAKGSFDEDASLASLQKTVQAESTTKKAAGKAAGAAGSPPTKGAGGAGKKQASEASANQGKGRAGRGKK